MFVGNHTEKFIVLMVSEVTAAITAPPYFAEAHRRTTWGRYLTHRSQEWNSEPGSLSSLMAAALSSTRVGIYLNLQQLLEGSHFGHCRELAAFCILSKSVGIDSNH